jgi:hypothetical protein
MPDPVSLAFLIPLITGLGRAVISKRYPKVNGAKSQDYDRGYINPDIAASLF